MENTLLWRPILILVLMWLAILNTWYWLWGIIILILVVHDLKRGATELIDKLSKNNNPYLYWITCLSWLLIAGMLITHTG